MAEERRFFVGDLHGCRAELDALLDVFGFRPGRDTLYSVGDVVGKGPDVPGTLQRLRDLGALAVAGNHDLSLVKTVRHPARPGRHREYLDSLGDSLAAWAAWIESWPLYRDLGDILLVHAGLEPGKSDPAEMSSRVLTQIRTWDGEGHDLNRPGDPPWFECVSPDRIVVFGHWAKRGLVDLPRFKGLDTGCVYGRELTGWCPEEDRFYRVPAARAYVQLG